MVALFHFRFGVEFHNQTRRFDHPLARADEGFHDDGQIASIHLTINCKQGLLFPLTLVGILHSFWE